jgi:hypothetical protein
LRPAGLHSKTLPQKKNKIKRERKRIKSSKEKILTKKNSRMGLRNPALECFKIYSNY